MILFGTVRVCRRTVVRLAAAAEENGTSVSRLASLAVEAAARLYKLDRLTNAVPKNIDWMFEAVADVSLSLPASCFVVLADAAISHDIALDEQLRAVLDAAVAAYDPIETKKLAAAERNVPKVKARPPFDPKYYSANAIIPDEALSGSGGPTATEITRAIAGDPGTGMGYFATRNGGQSQR